MLLSQTRQVQCLVKTLIERLLLLMGQTSITNIDDPSIWVITSRNSRQFLANTSSTQIARTDHVGSHVSFLYFHSSIKSVRKLSQLSASCCDQIRPNRYRSTSSR